MSNQLGFQFTEDGYRICHHVLEQTKRNLCKKVFYGADFNQKGHLSREDIKVAVAELFGYKPSKYEVSEILGKHGEESSDGDSGMVLTLDGFLLAMEHKYSTQDEDEGIRQTFLAFDAKCHGFLTVDDFRRIVSEVAPSLPSHYIEASFRELDQDGDGRLSYRDFDYMMKYDVDGHI